MLSRPIYNTDNSVNETGNQEVEGVSLGRDSGADTQARPGRNQATVEIENDIEDNINFNNIYTPSQNNILDLEGQCGDGGTLCMYKCGSKRCKFQNKYTPKDKVASSVTHRIYDCKVPDGTMYINCHTSNVIYLITCNHCHLQYVGETVQKLNERFAGHNLGINKPDKYGFCKILSGHFNSCCKNADYRVQILEKLKGKGRTERGALDASITQIRKAKEKEWMLKLRTVYPYGLNDRIGDEFKDDNCHMQVGNKFPALSRSFNRLGRGASRYGQYTGITGARFATELKRVLDVDLPNAVNFIRKSLSSMKKSHLKYIHNIISDEISDYPSEFSFSQWYLVILDIIECKLYKPTPPRNIRKSPDNICHIFFANKGLELLNLPRILHDPSLSDFLPLIPCKFEIPTVVYKLCDPIGSKIFNFNKFVDEIDLNEVLHDITSLPCGCTDSPFADPRHQHIVSGDLRIIKNSKLRKLFSKGPKYREPAHINWEDVKDSVVVGVRSCVELWCINKSVQPMILHDWLYALLKLVDDKIQFLKSTIKSHKVNPLLKRHEVKSSLKQLQDRFVICPIDKATGNIALVCKRFYALVLAKELGLINNVDNNDDITYRIEYFNSTEVIDQHWLDLKRLFNISCDQVNKCLPNMYWLPKMHKIPSKARFIVAAPVCSIKQLSKVVTTAFKIFFKQIEKYNKISSFFSGVNTFWIIQNNVPVINSVNQLNKRSAAKSITTFDFSTLYTKIPHDKLIYVLNSLVDFCFKSNDCKYLVITRYGAKWSNDISIQDIWFDGTKMKVAVAYLLDNCFFMTGKILFRQIIGIPMGSDPAPFFANLFLYFYENKWLKELKRVDLAKARRFGNTFRFIDDLTAINDGGEFERCFPDIYPPELELKKENVGNCDATFLDLDLNITDRKFNIKLFDKRDTFPFDIVRMPFILSNMPSTIFYSSIGAEILRISRVSNNGHNFIAASRTLLTRMISQGARQHRLLLILKKIYGRNISTFSHVASDAATFVSKLLI